MTNNNFEDILSNIKNNTFEKDEEYKQVILASPDYVNKLDYLRFKLGWCGCGNPESALKYILKIINYLLERNNHVHFDDSGYFVLYWLDKHEFTEHGCNISQSYVIDKGYMLKEAIELALEEDREQWM